MSRNGLGSEKICVMRVGELRRVLSDKEFDVDGSREARKNEEDLAKEDDNDESNSEEENHPLWQATRLAERRMFQSSMLGDNAGKQRQKANKT